MFSDQQQTVTHVRNPQLFFLEFFPEAQKKKEIVGFRCLQTPFKASFRRSQGVVEKKKEICFSDEKRLHIKKSAIQN